MGRAFGSMTALAAIVTVSTAAAGAGGEELCAAAPVELRSVACAEPSLRELDGKLRQYLAGQLEGLSEGTANEVRATQEKWRDFVVKACPPIAAGPTAVAACLKRMYDLRLRHVEAFDKNGATGKFFFRADYAVRSVGDPTDERGHLEKVYAVELVDTKDRAASVTNATFDELARTIADNLFAQGDTDVVVEVVTNDAFHEEGDVVHQYAISTETRTLPAPDAWEKTVSLRYFQESRGRFLSTTDLFVGGKWMAVMRTELARQADRQGSGRQFARIPGHVIVDLTHNISHWTFGVDGIAVRFAPGLLRENDDSFLVVPWKSVAKHLTPLGRRLSAWGAD